jgi:anti-sigma factor RsiW
MGTASTITPTDLDTTRSRSLRREAAIAAVAATAANVAVWAAGRAADVSFLVSPLIGTPTQVGIVLVVLTTLIAFAVGMGLFALASRRSDGWARAVLAAGVLFAVVSTVGPLSTAEDTSTGVLLASMHLLTGAAFAITASRSWR